MKLLDSSVIIAFFRKNEDLHVDAVNIFMKDDKFLLLDHVLAEVLTVIKLREGFEVAKKCAEFLSNVKDLEIFHTNSDLFTDTCTFFANNKNKLSFVDTLLLIFARSKKIELLTFDRELGEMASNRI